ncbi:porin [Glaciimonas sp. PAMC28666]|uniref:porin n=1 Tax=Glaciimonas sp. PAMC28666 TaxID=2807626 RepID=UPI0019628EB6|nr:porin [Glaciimonas sp. PAMC28666]QRX81763.1 porin [Glaciimonas sp. PAMC28666]
MKSKYATLAMISSMAGVSSVASAQLSNITIYGIIDAGIDRVSNAGAGHSNLILNTGIMQGNRLGFKGTEDLGSGTQMIFDLENGFSLDNGAMGQGGFLFGRQAWVGLTDQALGTLLVGRQYDFMTDLEAFYTATWGAGGYANHPLDNDRMSGQRVNNSVKYLSPVYSGLQFGAMVGLSESAGNFNGTNRTYSFDAIYTNGPFSMGAAYTDVSGQTLDIAPIVGSVSAVNVGGDYQQVWGSGAKYSFSKVTIYGAYSQATYAGSLPAQYAKFHNYDFGFAYAPTEVNVYAVGYTYTTLSGGNKYGQLNLNADHFLSKRTDIYVQAIIQQATSAGATADIISMPGSSGSSQIIYRVGMRTKF